MSIEPNRTFGSRFNSQAAASQPAAETRPKAQFWLNVGYVSNVKDEDGTYRFVSLAQGIPLDSVEAFKAAQPGVEVHVYAANHGFNCDHRAAYNQPAAALALERTLAFFTRHVG